LFLVHLRGYLGLQQFLDPWLVLILLCRVTVTLDTTPPVLGIGDHRARRDAERLAALSALYQLHDTGLVCVVNFKPFNYSNGHT
jgi:hypothetical protein